ncbi:MAG: hypothetical protein ABI162_01580 [Luteolibacter sp.]
MQLATTLVHKGAMPIAVHAIHTFRIHFAATHRLEIHTDGSPDAKDCEELLAAAGGMDVRIVIADDRAPIVAEKLRNYPKTRELLARGAYFTKLELPMVAEEPYFYFDSDIVWLRPADNLVPEGCPNAFSTESWSWYYGVCNDRLWIREKTPRRVNSGFYHIGEAFPYERMEDMLERKMFDPTIPYNTDQEIMAYLFRNMAIYHPEDLKRSRVGRHYNLAEEQCAALHFPGRMWLPHMDQIEALAGLPATARMGIRQQVATPLTHAELIRMRFYMKLATSRAVRFPVDTYRKIRNRLG